MNIVSEVSLTYKTKVKNSERKQVHNSNDSVEIFRSIERFNDNVNLYECFYAMYLNRANKVLSVMLISEGGTAGTIIDNKKVIAPAILQNACAIIVSHNHPSGNTKPSDADILITDKLKKACDLLEIKLLDHIIITDESYYSFADEGLM
jgi:DNA repair protein RadC